MNVECKTIGKVLVVKALDSRIESANVQGLSERVIERLEKGHCTKILFDLGHVEFVDSSGLGAMVSLFKRLPESGTLAICGAGERVLSLFRLTRLNKVFLICATEEDGLQMLAETDPAATSRQPLAEDAR